MLTRVAFRGRNQKRRIQALQAAVAWPSESNQLPSPPEPTIRENTSTNSKLSIDPDWPSETFWTKPAPPSNLLPGDGLTALHLAVRSGNETITRILLDSGANINSQDARFRTALHLAAENGYNNIVELLLARSANLNIADITGRTPLFAAVQSENEAIVVLLLASQAEVNMMDVLGNSPLHVAVATGSETLTTLLLSHGANVNAQFVLNAIE